MKTPRLAIAFVLSSLVAGPAAAQATRTWVSGVGDDANPCSRTAPCKTFAGAISKTAAGGEINALDPGGFGGVTITKAISIEADGVLAGVLVSGTNGITVAAGANDTVVLRGLTIEGVGTGVDGVHWQSGKSLVVEKCTIKGFTGQGIDAEPNSGGAARLFVTDTEIRDNAGGGILAKTAGGTSLSGTVMRVQFNNNNYAVTVQDNAFITVKDSIGSQSTSDGFIVQGVSAAAILFFENSAAVSNTGAGVRSIGANSLLFIGNSASSGNHTGLSPETGGAIVSFGNNRVTGNTTIEGFPTMTIGMK